jgi:hypothetical protein
MDFEDQLSTAMRSSVETLTPPVTGLVAEGLERGRRRLRRQQLTRGVAAAATVVILLGVAAALRNDRGAGTVAVAGTGCHSVVRTGVLPTWARAGFSPATSPTPHVLSARGAMAAILFVPLSSPPADGTNNKILWVARETTGLPLRIDAVRAGTTTHVHRNLAGVGPSIVDLPQPGCWHLVLRWGSHRDTIDLNYAAP